MIWRLYVAMAAPAAAEGDESEGVIHCASLTWNAAAMAHLVAGRRVMRQLAYQGRVAYYGQPGADLYLTVGVVAVQIAEPSWWNRTLADAILELGIPPAP